jgi:FtsZ-binding cell division protein ZapB
MSDQQDLEELAAALKPFQDGKKRERELEVEIVEAAKTITLKDAEIRERDAEIQRLSKELHQARHSRDVYMRACAAIRGKALMLKTAAEEMITACDLEIYGNGRQETPQPLRGAPRLTRVP